MARPAALGQGFYSSRQSQAGRALRKALTQHTAGGGTRRNKGKAVERLESGGTRAPSDPRPVELGHRPAACPAPQGSPSPAPGSAGTMTRGVPACLHQGFGTCSAGRQAKTFVCGGARCPCWGRAALPRGQGSSLQEKHEAKPPSITTSRERGCSKAEGRSLRAGRGPKAQVKISGSLQQSAASVLRDLGRAPQPKQYGEAPGAELSPSRHQNAPSKGCWGWEGEVEAAERGLQGGQELPISAWARQRG